MPNPKQKNSKTSQPKTSYRSQNAVVEMIHDPDNATTAFLVSNGRVIESVQSFKLNAARSIVPYESLHPFLTNRVIRFPQEAAGYGTVDELKIAVRSYIHKYVDLSPTFETIATHYVLLTWIFDMCSVLGYLRIQGDFGTGKTRFLTVIGNICYKPIFASGATTVAPLFHMLDEIGGTLIMDESDFYHSNEKSLIAKIFNNGNASGFPVLRCERANDQSFSTRSYSVFGPKILASRGRFDDPALESRFLTEDSGICALRDDIPLELDEEAEQESLKLRNKLLMFRFKMFREEKMTDRQEATELSPRMCQIISPLLRFMDDTERKEVMAWAKNEEAQQRRDRGMELPTHIVSVLRTELYENKITTMGDIAKSIMEKFSEYYDYPVTAKSVGVAIRNILHLRTIRVNGRYAVPSTEKEKVALWAKRFDL